MGLCKKIIKNWFNDYNESKKNKITTRPPKKTSTLFASLTLSVNLSVWTKFSQNSYKLRDFEDYGVHIFREIKLCSRVKVYEL